MMLVNVTCINDTNVDCISRTNCTPCDTNQPLNNYAKARIIIYIATFLLSLLGNGCVILVTLRRFYRKQPATAFKLLITHLAFVDFLFSCNVFVLVPNEIYNAESEDGLPMCIIKRFLRQVPMEASIGTITVIAVERYRGITKDFQVRRWTRKRVFLSLLVVWILSFAIYIPSTISLKTTRGDIDCLEFMSSTQRKLHTVFMLLAEYIMPLSVVAFCNYKIIRTMRNRSSTLTGLREDDSEQRDKEQRRTVRILIAVVVGFAIIALPNQVFFVYVDFRNKQPTESVTWEVLQLIGVLLLVHSLFNPIIYSVMDIQFREDVKELFCCCQCLPCTLQRNRSTTVTTSGGNHPAEIYVMRDTR